MKITKNNFPNIHRALQEVEYDNGAHLLEFYGLTAVDLNEFVVGNNYDFEFIEHQLSTVDIELFAQTSKPNLKEANQLLDDYFNGVE